MGVRSSVAGPRTHEHLCARLLSGRLETDQKTSKLAIDPFARCETNDAASPSRECGLDLASVTDTRCRHRPLLSSWFFKGMPTAEKCMRSISAIGDFCPFPY